MKTKKTFLILPIWTLILAAAVFFLRRGQVLTAFEETGLLTPGSGYTYALVAVAAVAVASAVGLSWRMGKGLTNSVKAGLMPEGYTPYFTQSWPFAMLVAVSGGGMMAAGLLTLMRYRAMAITGGIYLLFGGGMLLAGLAVVFLAWRNLDKTRVSGQARGKNSARANQFAWELLLPGFALMVWLIQAYQQHTANPCVWEYAPLLLGLMCGGAACLGMAGFSFEKVRPILALTASSLCVVLLAGAMADLVYYDQNPFDSLRWVLKDGYGFALGGVMLFCWTQMTTLSYRLQNPAETADDREEAETMDNSGEAETENHIDTL